jgi:hypothetical protein
MDIFILETKRRELLPQGEIMIELDNRLPASPGDMEESYEDDILCRDAIRATNLPGRTLALVLPCEVLLRDQSEERCQEETVMALLLGTR